MIKILVVGDFNSLIHEEAISNELILKGNDVHKFSVSNYFNKYYILRKLYNFQIQLKAGPFIFFVNYKLKKIINNNNFDLIFFYRPVIIDESVFKLSCKNSKIYIYNNDDPFGFQYPEKFWKKYFLALKYAHKIFFYRNKNKSDFQHLGFTNTFLLRSYYIKSLNYPLNVSTNKYTSDVSFIGHYENDGRDIILKYLLDEGINLKIFGPEWRKSSYYIDLYKKIGKIFPLQEDYNLAINSTKIALIFFSKLNNDSYTRRCFEIPATKTLMLCEYTKEMSELFVEDEEIIFFKNKEDLLLKIKYFLNNENIRDKIANNAYKRLQLDKHEVSDRVDIILRQYQLDNK